MSGLRTVADRMRPMASILMRVVAVTITLYPAIRKFTEYARRVSEFRSYGLPWPELAVPLTGVVEIVAIISIGLGIAGRLGAGALVIGMVVATLAAGPNPFSVLVLLASVGLCLLGTGPYSYWNPALGDVLGGQRAALIPSRGRGERE